MGQRKSVKRYIIKGSILLATICIGIIIYRQYFSNVNKSTLEGEITFVSNRTDKEAEIQELISEFEKMHPKVNVKLEVMGEIEDVLQRRITVGELPDVTLVPGSVNTSEYSKFFLPIDDLGFNDENIYNYISGTSNNRKLYCLSSAINWQCVIYNKELFKDAGIDEIPTTIDKFFEACEKLKEIGVTPVGVNFRQPWVMNIWAETIPGLFDEDIAKDIVAGKKEVLGKDSAVYKALTFVRDIVSKGYSEPVGVNYDWQQFKIDMSEGKVAMTIYNSDFTGQLEDLGMDKDSIGIFPIPETEVIRVYGDYMLAVSKNTLYPEVAKAFLSFLFEESRYAEAINTMSPLKNNIKNEEIISEIDKFGIPIMIYSDYVDNQTVQVGILESEYLDIKRDTQLDGYFVQEYIFTEDLKGFINNTNELWKNKLEK